MFEQATQLDSDRKGAGVANVAGSATPRLLVIDDDSLHRMIICRAAARAGYAPAGAASYGEAAKILQEAPFDCITLDLSLGSDAGVEMLRHLRETRSNAPIIVIGGRDGASCRETVRVARSLDLNIWQSMPKPVDLVVLRYWFERLKSERETAAAAA